MAVKTNDKRVQQYIGWVGLGICFDYFILKPIRLLRPVFMTTIGFGLGMLLAGGMVRVAGFIKYIIG